MYAGHDRSFSAKVPGGAPVTMVRLSPNGQTLAIQRSPYAVVRGAREMEL
jgi:hypothetical protein